MCMKDWREFVNTCFITNLSDVKVGLSVRVISAVLVKLSQCAW